MDLKLTGKITIKRTRDIDVINKIMLRDDIFSVISEDGVTKEEQRFDVYNEYWLQVIFNGESIGLYNLHYTNQSTLQAHAHILPEFRVRHSNDSILKIYEWVIDNCKESTVKFISEIPSIYPNVLRFCLSNGFTHEGVNRQSYLKNGRIHDVDLVGITKSEMMRFLNG